MVKNVQLKIILIFTVLTIVLITGISAYFLHQLQDINAQIVQEANKDQLASETSDIVKQGTWFMIYAIVGFCLIATVVFGFITAKVTKPINKLISSAKRIAAGEEVEIKKVGQKEDKQVNELVDAFGLMTSELKENLNEVSRQKNQIETILLHMTDGIIAFNMEGKIILVNPAATRLLRIMPEEETFEKIFEKLNIEINMEKIIYLDNWTSSEERVTLGDTNINLFFAPLKNENETPAGVMVVIQDITEHVKLDNMRKEFVADVSHELKTPIALIQGYSEGLIENVNTDEENRKFYAEVILDEANKMDKLVAQLLELMKLEYGKREFNNKEFDICELIREVIRKSKVMLEERQIEVDFSVELPVYVLADDFYIEQVITNYFTNAIKHVNEKNGKKIIQIRIEQNKQEGTARIYVFNTGELIEEENLTRIWNRFYKVDESRNREDGGTGIGLSLVKAIMNNYKKQYGVTNMENGVEFYFDLEIVE